MSLRCCWYEPVEEPGTRMLLPGCMERVLDADADCTCPTTAEEIDRLKAEYADLASKAAGTSHAFSDLMSAVSAHRDAKAIFADADARTAAHADQVRDLS